MFRVADALRAAKILLVPSSRWTGVDVQLRMVNKRRRCFSLALLPLLLPGCASTPGEPGLEPRLNPNDPAVIQQTKIDRATCIGEATKAEANSALRAKFNFDAVYDNCMAKRGYARQ
jgi:hypothetical protein